MSRRCWCISPSWVQRWPQHFSADVHMGLLLEGHSCTRGWHSRGVLLCAPDADEDGVACLGRLLGPGSSRSASSANGEPGIPLLEPRVSQCKTPAPADMKLRLSYTHCRLGGSGSLPDPLLDLMDLALPGMDRRDFSHPCNSSTVRPTRLAHASHSRLRLGASL